MILPLFSLLLVFLTDNLHQASTTSSLRAWSVAGGTIEHFPLGWQDPKPGVSRGSVSLLKRIFDSWSNKHKPRNRIRYSESMSSAWLSRLPPQCALGSRVARIWKQYEACLLPSPRSGIVNRANGQPRASESIHNWTWRSFSKMPCFINRAPLAYCPVDVLQCQTCLGRGHRQDLQNGPSSAPDPLCNVSSQDTQRLTGSCPYIHTQEAIVLCPDRPDNKAAAD